LRPTAVLILLFPLLGCTGERARTFETVISAQDGTLLSAWIASDGTAYLAGGVVGGGAGQLLRWDGRSVTAVPTPDAHAFWWIYGVSDHDIWLAGESGEVHHFDGATVTRVDAGAPSGSILFGIWGSPEGGELWAVGGSFVSGGPRQVILHRAGGTWSAIPSPDGVDPDVTYFKVWGASASKVWIVGDRGIVLRGDGAAFAIDDAPRVERYVTVHGCGESDVYAVGGGGNGSAIHFDGAAWAPIALPDVPPINGVACVAGGAAYLGGFSGYAARFAGGAAQPLALPAALQALAIHGIAAGPGRIVAVGGDLVAPPGAPQQGFAVELLR
jgi:hypothetical protein